MRKLTMMGLGLCTFGAFTLGTRVWADGPNKGDSPAVQDNPSSGIISRLFPDDDKGPIWRIKAKRQKDRLENATAKKSARSKSDSNKTEVKKPVDSAPKEPNAHEKEMAEVKREQAAYLRRLAVCDQLRDIALKNNDDNLNRQADELQAQAWAIYSKHVASFSAGKAGREGQDAISNHSAKMATQGSGQEVISEPLIPVGPESEPSPSGN
jgi:hypothetical protein